MRAVVRFIASVLTVSGVLLIADAVTTVAWQEPISWLMQGRQQAELRDALADPPKPGKDPLPGAAIGKIEIPAIGVSKFVVEGTDVASLRKGPGHYPKTPLPGQRGTVGIAGHRTTYGAPFRHIDDLRPGQEVIVDIPSARFVYRVERTRIVPPTALWVTRKVGHDRLILSACHPLYSAAKRVVVFARFDHRSRRTSIRR